jgi:hypothetical protein
MLNQDYQKDIDNVILILKKICVDNNYPYRDNNSIDKALFMMDVPEFERKGYLYQRFSIKITTSSDKYQLKFIHNGFDDTKFIIDLPLYLNINPILPSLVRTYIDNIFLHRKKVLEIRDLLDSYQDFCNKTKSPEYIRELKIKKILE